MPHPLLRQRFLPPDFFAKLGEAGVSVFAPIPGSREVTPDLCGWTPSDPPVPPAQVDSERLCQAELPRVSMKHWSYEMETNHDTWGKVSRDSPSPGGADSGREDWTPKSGAPHGKRPNPLSHLNLFSGLQEC